MPRLRFVVMALLLVSMAFTLPRSPHHSELIRTEASAPGSVAFPPIGGDGLAAAIAEQQAVARWNEAVWNDAVWNDAVAEAERERAAAAAATVTPARHPAGPGTPTGSSPVPSSGGGSAEAAVRKYFGDIFDQAWGVSQCESGHDPTAISPGGANYGLFQINSVHRGDFEAVTGKPWSSVLEADANAQYARHLYDQQGWGPWSCAWAA